MLISESLVAFATNTIHPDLLEIAHKKGIMTDNMTNLELKSILSEKLIEKQKVEYQEKAKKLGIDTNGLTDAKVKEKVVAKENEEMVVKAKKLGIDSTGLDYNQLLVKVKTKEI